MDSRTTTTTKNTREETAGQKEMLTVIQTLYETFYDRKKQQSGKFTSAKVPHLANETRVG